MSNNTAPTLRRATALALLSTMSNVGSIVSAWVLGALSAPPRYTGAISVLLAFQLGLFACATGHVLWLRAENRRREGIRAEAGVVAEVDGPGLKNDSVWYTYVL